MMRQRTSLLLPVVAGIRTPPAITADLRGVYQRGGNKGTLRMQGLMKFTYLDLSV